MVKFITSKYEKEKKQNVENTIAYAVIAHVHRIN